MDAEIESSNSSPQKPEVARNAESENTVHLDSLPSQRPEYIQDIDAVRKENRLHIMVRVEHQERHNYHLRQSLRLVHTTDSSEVAEASLLEVLREHLMHRRFYVQRQHIIHSLDTLLYQLHTLSFFLSPSVWIYVCRITAQWVWTPRDVDSHRSLRICYLMILVLNLSGIVKHARHGVDDGRPLVLDFVGMSYTPSRLQICSLDFLIIFVQFLLTTIAFETTMYYASEDRDAVDMLLSESSTPDFLPIPLFQGPSRSTPSLSNPSSPMSYPPPPLKPSTSTTALPFILDLRFRNIITRIRNPPPAPRPSTDSMLPLPNTTSLALPGLRMLLRASGQVRAAATATANAQVVRTDRQEMRIPGAMDSGPDR